MFYSSKDLRSSFWSVTRLNVNLVDWLFNTSIAEQNSSSIDIDLDLTNESVFFQRWQENLFKKNIETILSFILVIRIESFSNCAEK